MDTEEKIVPGRAASSLLIHGFSAATTKAIAAEAGVAEVTLFRCFGDKRIAVSKGCRAYIAGDLRADGRSPT